MSDPRLPIKGVRIPGGAILRFASGESLYVYGRDPEIAKPRSGKTHNHGGPNYWVRVFI